MFADAHIHLAALDPQVADDIAATGRDILAVTCSPSEYLGAADRFARYENVRLALGLHPWRMSEGFDTAELDAFLELAPKTRFIGEVGLDFHKGFSSSRGTQLQAFERICRCLSEGEHIISLHSRKAAAETLDMLERFSLPQTSTCILHGYNGPSDQMTRALKLGCRFSLGQRELNTKRGREYARQLPPERLLFETDADGTKPFTCVDWRALVSSWPS